MCVYVSMCVYAHVEFNGRILMGVCLRAWVCVIVYLVSVCVCGNVCARMRPESQWWEIGYSGIGGLFVIVVGATTEILGEDCSILVRVPLSHSGNWLWRGVSCE